MMREAFVLVGLTIALLVGGAIYVRSSAAELARAPVVREPVIAEIAEPPKAPIVRDLSPVLPTDNTALFRDDGAAFYQTVGRAIRGLRASGWEGGQYGWVRDPVRTRGGLTFSRFHEGLDIRPVARDSRGEPTDEVRALDGGTVVHASRSATGSNYGRYVVVEHTWSGAPVYTLYAHLADVEVQRGQEVKRGAALGTMGYTGRGIDKDRAHVHLEVAMMLNPDFDAWFSQTSRGYNAHGAYIGLNLVGVDPAGLFASLRENPALRFADFVRAQPPEWAAVVPGPAAPEILDRYPWLLDDSGGVRRDSTGEAPAWTVHLTRSGIPVRIAPADTSVRAPALIWTDPAVVAADLPTNGFLTRAGGGYQLTVRARQYLALLWTRGQRVPQW